MNTNAKIGTVWGVPDTKKNSSPTLQRTSSFCKPKTSSSSAVGSILASVVPARKHSAISNNPSISKVKRSDLVRIMSREDNARLKAQKLLTDYELNAGENDSNEGNNNKVRPYGDREAGSGTWHTMLNNHVTNISDKAGKVRSFLIRKNSSTLGRSSSDLDEQNEEECKKGSDEENDLRFPDREERALQILGSINQSRGKSLPTVIQKSKRRSDKSKASSKLIFSKSKSSIDEKSDWKDVSKSEDNCYLGGMNVETDTTQHDPNFGSSLSPLTQGSDERKKVLGSPGVGGIISNFNFLRKKNSLTSRGDDFDDKTGSQPNEKNQPNINTNLDNGYGFKKSKSFLKNTFSPKSRLKEKVVSKLTKDDGFSPGNIEGVESSLTSLEDEEADSSGFGITQRNASLLINDAKDYIKMNETTVNSTSLSHALPKRLSKQISNVLNTGKKSMCVESCLTSLEGEEAGSSGLEVTQRNASLLIDDAKGFIKMNETTMSNTSFAYAGPKRLSKQICSVLNTGKKAVNSSLNKEESLVSSYNTTQMKAEEMSARFESDNRESYDLVKGLEQDMTHMMASESKVDISQAAVNAARAFSNMSRSVVKRTSSVLKSGQDRVSLIKRRSRESREEDDECDQMNGLAMEAMEREGGFGNGEQGIVINAMREPAAIV